MAERNKSFKKNQQPIINKQERPPLWNVAMKQSSVTDVEQKTHIQLQQELCTQKGHPSPKVFTQLRKNMHAYTYHP